MASALKPNPLQKILLQYPTLVDTVYGKTLWQFLCQYFPILEQQKRNWSSLEESFSLYFSAIQSHLKDPVTFGIRHVAKEHYRQMSLDIMEPLIDKANSRLFGLDNLDWIKDRLEKKENVFLLSNHQIEAEPQAINLMLGDAYRSISEKMIFVAGERVITDPLAVPFSLGCHLFCIYSKKYFALMPEKKAQMASHNRATIQAMRHALNEGGHCIYVAPSGGRDRPNDQGVLSPAPFDERSVDLMLLLGHHSQQKTHYCPLALHTYDVLPPPEDINLEIGEARNTQNAPITMHFGSVLNITKSGSSCPTKTVYNAVKNLYTGF